MKKFLIIIFKTILCLCGLVPIIGGIGITIACFFAKNLFTVIICIALAILLFTCGISLFYISLKKIPLTKPEANRTLQNMVNHTTTKNNAYILKTKKPILQKEESNSNNTETQNMSLQASPQYLNTSNINSGNSTENITTLNTNEALKKIEIAKEQLDASVKQLNELLSSGNIATSTTTALSKDEDKPSTPVLNVKFVQQEVPQEILNDMRTHYSMQQAANDMRIIDESLEIMENTPNIETFLSRYETAMERALTLEQAKKAGIPITLPDNFSQSLLNAKAKALAGVLYRSFEKELNEINKLKTDNGKLNRINKYQEKLEGTYEDVFEFVAEDSYNDVMQQLENLKRNF